MSRRTTDRSDLRSTPLAPPPHRAPLRSTQNATSAGTLRFAERTALSLTGFRRTLPRKLTVSVLGAGTYLGDCTDEEDARYAATLRAALADGVNLLDTASNYRCQRSERVVGKVVVEAIASGHLRRDEVVVCTKGGYVALDGEPPSSREAYDQWLEETLIGPGVLRRDELARGGHSLSPAFIEHQIRQSLGNLGLTSIDVYYLHNPEEQLLVLDRAEFVARLREAFALLEERAESGEIAAYGCATWTGFRVPPEHRQHLTLAELLAVAREVGGTAHHFRAVQLPVSLAMPEAARVPTQPQGRKLVPFLEAADALGVGVIASAPLMQGRLTDGLPGEVRELFPGCTSDAQRALRFATELPGVTAALAGMRRPDHLKDNLGAWKYRDGSSRN